jgi:16S rRNA (guanine527-N7)-methyltransferase
VYLLDSNSKKTRFLVEVKARLKLDNVRVVNARVEDFTAQTFDELICRAFCPLSELLKKVQHLVSEDGQVFAMLGQKPSSDDLANFPANSWTMSVLQVPLLEDARHLLTIKAH